MENKISRFINYLITLSKITQYSSYSVFSMFGRPPDAPENLAFTPESSKLENFFCLWSELSLCSGLKFNHLVAGKLRNANCYRVSIALQIDRNSAWCQEGFFNPGQAEVDFGMVKRGKLLNDFDTASARGVAAGELNDSTSTDGGRVEEVQDKAIPL